MWPLGLRSPQKKGRNVKESSKWQDVLQTQSLSEQDEERKRNHTWFLVVSALSRVSVPTQGLQLDYYSYQIQNIGSDCTVYVSASSHPFSAAAQCSEQTSCPTSRIISANEKPALAINFSGRVLRVVATHTQLQTLPPFWRRALFATQLFALSKSANICCESFAASIGIITNKPRDLITSRG